MKKRILFILIVSGICVFGNSQGDKEYRFKGDRIALESATNRGLTREEITPKTPQTLPRKTPLPVFVTEGQHPNKPGNVEQQQVVAQVSSHSIEIVESGFPLPQGALFDLQHLRVLNHQGIEIPIQTSITNFWPDGSIRWVLIQCFAQDQITVEFGNQVKRKTFQTPLRFEKSSNGLTIYTGKIEAKLDTVHFQLLSQVRSSTHPNRSLGSFSPEGIILKDAAGIPYTTSALPPESVSIEQQGPLQLVVRVEGNYGNKENSSTFMRYVTRLVFRANSSRVEITHRHINTELDREFTDFQSLEIPFNLSNSSSEGTLLLSEEDPLLKGKQISLFQEDDQKSIWLKEKNSGNSKRALGILGVETESGQFTVGITDFWQRWPKGISLNQEKVNIALLPQQPDQSFGSKLPSNLLFPFVNGLYRLKWGMSFTERIHIDFNEKNDLTSFAQAVNEPAIATFPSTWYASTGALGLMAPAHGDEFSEWDAFFEEATDAYLKRREQNREYGFLNYGDWWGERGRNWGNNEYDIAHAFFMQYARTGNPEYYRIALAASRHQADVDIVHAYPDPKYIGANHQHSVGHTGHWSQVPKFSTWSHAYDAHTDASNGHTWAEGMTEAWYLNGEATVMESVRLLGEHIAWAVAPGFQMSTAYPRSAGWSLRAIVAIYRATGDPEYFRASKEIAENAINSQDASGIWLKRFKVDQGALKKDLSKSSKGKEEEYEYAISNFQLGLMLAGLVQYYQINPDSHVKEAIHRGAVVLAKAWPGAGGWPYNITKEGTASPTRPSQMLTGNVLNADSLAYMGMLENNPSFLKVAEESLQNVIFYKRPTAQGQEIGLLLRSASMVLGGLHYGYRKNETHWPGVSVEKTPETFFKGAPSSLKFGVRGPGKLVFLLKTKGNAQSLPLVRTNPNAPSKTHQSQGVFRLKSAINQSILFEENATFIGGTTQTFSIPLPSGKGNLFLLEIDEPERGQWNPDASDLEGIMMQAHSKLLLSSLGGLVQYAFASSKNEDSLEIEVRGVHKGSFGMAVLNPEGKVLGYRLGVNEAGIAAKGGKLEETLSLTLSPEDRGKVLTLLLLGSGDLYVQIKGEIPWIARTRTEYITQ